MEALNSLTDPDGSPTKSVTVLSKCRTSYHRE
jgi:hypothetical protein